MRVYHFLNKEYGLKDIRERRLKISLPTELNDPFEFLAANLSEPELRKWLRWWKKELAKKHGLLCVSKSWRNPVQWTHYADRHRGVCLGLDMPTNTLKKVRYVTSRFDWPSVVDESTVEMLLYTKFAHWRYENEYRAFLHLDAKDGDLYFADFSDSLVLRQVIVGAESDVSRADLRDALGGLASDVNVFKARPAFKSFRIVQNEKPALWR
jgi:hypothetical protein